MNSGHDHFPDEIRKGNPLLPPTLMSGQPYRSPRRWPRRILARASAILRRRPKKPRWNGLLELEQAQSDAERRLLIIREFSHLASDALVASPSRRRSWPSIERITALHNAATVLLSSATDRSSPCASGDAQRESPDNDDLVAAIRTLVGYLALQQALQQAPVLDPEPMRLLAREHTRLRMMFDQTMEWLRTS